jgi:ferredoxin
MASMQTLDVVDRSATTTPTPQVRQMPHVAKLIDESKCIGCKACQVACMQWNDLRDEVGTNVGVYDNPSDLTATSWTVMRFFEVEPKDGSLEWLIRKDGCMHCEDPGCLKVRQRHRRLQFRALHRLRLLRQGLPLRRAPHQRQGQQGLQVHLVLRPRGCGPGAGLCEDLSHRGHQLRSQGRDGGLRREACR